MSPAINWILLDKNILLVNFQGCLDWTLYDSKQWKSIFKNIGILVTPFVPGTVRLSFSDCSCIIIAFSVLCLSSNDGAELITARMLSITSSSLPSIWLLWIALFSDHLFRTSGPPALDARATSLLAASRTASLALASVDDTMSHPSGGVRLRNFLLLTIATSSGFLSSCSKYSEQSSSLLDRLEMCSSPSLNRYPLLVDRGRTSCCCCCCNCCCCCCICCCCCRCSNMSSDG